MSRLGRNAIVICQITYIRTIVVDMVCGDATDTINGGCTLVSHILARNEKLECTVVRCVEERIITLTKSEQ